jgi:hypothetical protein
MVTMATRLAEHAYLTLADVPYPLSWTRKRMRGSGHVYTAGYQRFTMLKGPAMITTRLRLITCHEE